jgi:hypothetical protein
LSNNRACRSIAFRSFVSGAAGWIRLKVVYGDTPGLPPNVGGEGFAPNAPEHTVRLWSATALAWPAMECATRRHADVMIMARSCQRAWSRVAGQGHGVPTVLWGHGYSKQDAAARARGA